MRCVGYELLETMLERARGIRTDMITNSREKCSLSNTADSHERICFEQIRPWTGFKNRVILKKVSFGIFRLILDYKDEKKNHFICYFHGDVRPWRGQLLRSYVFPLANFHRSYVSPNHGHSFLLLMSFFRE